MNKSQSHELPEIRFREVAPPVLKTIYVAGPMSGLPNFNFQAFHTATEALRSEGWTVLNPAEKQAEEEIHKAAMDTGDTALAVKNGFSFRAAYLWDLQSVLVARAIYMLKGWETSPGARGEHAVAVALQQYCEEGFDILYE